MIASLVMKKFNLERKFLASDPHYTTMIDLLILKVEKVEPLVKSMTYACYGWLANVTAGSV